MELKKLIQKAQNAHELNELSYLADHQNPIVRRVVAKNKHTPTKLLHILSYDPVMNVSYAAVNNPNNHHTNRKFDEAHPCVVCSKDELFMNCKSCETLLSYN
jgi:hypothetical protein